MEPLKTLKGSRIWYSKFGVGKKVGSKIYFHKSVWDKIVPKEVWNKAQHIINSVDTEQELWKMGWIEFEYNTVCYDLKNPDVLRFDGCPGFDLQREPVVGWMMFVDTENERVRFKNNPQIYHHRWLFVESDYDGFDVQASYEWSNHWLSKLPEVASGYQHKWKEQLRKYNII